MAIFDEWENVNWHEAYERMKWCEQAVKALTERSPQMARTWWDKECIRPDWLETLPTPGESMDAFAQRLEEEVHRWGEAASILPAEIEAAESEERQQALRALDRGLWHQRRRLELIRQCQSIPEAERKNHPILCGEFGYTYLMEKHRWVRKERSMVLESYPQPRFKIGATNRPWKKRSKELIRQKNCMPMQWYATVIPFELEQKLHAHYDPFRVRRAKRQKGERKNISGEQFWLPQLEINRFREVIAKN
jgi:hypothetical protein